MNLYSLMAQRYENGGPIKVGVIGAGKFSSMFITQASVSPYIHVCGIADLDEQKARDALRKTGWEEDRYDFKDLDSALRQGGTHVTDNASQLIEHPEIELILEITGNPHAGAIHASKAIDHGKHVVMVNVEADCMLGPILARKAKQAGVVYSMAYGDQPALISELVDWCRTVGFEVICAGKGTKYLPEYERSTPDTVWDYYGFSKEQLEGGDFNPQMFNSFLDGTKSAIEMAAVANGCGLVAPKNGLSFIPAGVDDLATKFREQKDGGELTQTGTVEIASSLNRDGSPVHRDLRWGVYVTFKAQTEYAAQCFAEYGMNTDSSGYCSALYRPYHLIGLELGVSVASAVLRNEATGQARDFNADVVTVAKKDLAAGDMLDGEGGYTVRGEIYDAPSSMLEGCLPMGLAASVKVRNPIQKGSRILMKDVELDTGSVACKLRDELRLNFG